MPNQYIRSDGAELEFSKERLDAYQKLQEIWAGDQKNKLIGLVSALKVGRDLPDDCLELAEELKRAGILESEFIKLSRKHGWHFWDVRVKVRYSYADSKLMHFVFKSESPKPTLERLRSADSKRVTFAPDVPTALQAQAMYRPADPHVANLRSAYVATLKTRFT